MSNPRICPSCNCVFHQDFVCTTCGAEKLYDATVESLRARVVELKEILNDEIDINRAALDLLKERCGYFEEQLVAMTKERDLLIKNAYQVETLKFDLAASQAREKVLREALLIAPRMLEALAGCSYAGNAPTFREASAAIQKQVDKAITTPADTSTIDALLRVLEAAEELWPYLDPNSDVKSYAEACRNLSEAIDAAMEEAK